MPIFFLYLLAYFKYINYYQWFGLLTVQKNVALGPPEERYSGFTTIHAHVLLTS